MNIYFSEDEMVEYLLNKGYVISCEVEDVSENIYQNVFVDSQRVVVKAYKGSHSSYLSEAFNLEIKKQILS